MMTLVLLPLLLLLRGTFNKYGSLVYIFCFKQSFLFRNIHPIVLILSRRNVIWAAKATLEQPPFHDNEEEEVAIQ